MTCPTEDAEQRALARKLDRAGLRWCHVPNGGRRDRREGRNLRAQGVKAGVPDVLLFERPPLDSRAVGVALELKRENGRPSDVRPNQREWLQALSERGWRTHVAYGCDDAVRFLRGLGYDL